MKGQSLFQSTGFLLFCLLLLSIFSRIPLLYPDSMILDGDESLMGLMSIHQIEKGEMPWYFWGQRYGFTLIEVSSISLFHLLFGYQQIAVKLGMMLLWLLTLTGSFLFLKEKLGKGWAFVIVLLFAFHPVWFYWSLKARGGYLSALMISSWLFYFASIHERIKPWFQGIIQGIGLVLIFHTMKLWFPSSLVLLIGLLWYSRKKQWMLFTFIVSAGLSQYMLHQLSLKNPDYWNPQVMDFELWGHNIISMRERLRHFFEGNYFLGDIYEVKNWTYNAWQLTKVGFFSSLFLAILRFKENKKSVEFWAITLAAAIPFGVMLISPMFFNPRYLLPLPLFLFIWCVFQWKDVRYTRLLQKIWIPFALVFLAGAIQLTQTSFYKQEVWEYKTRKEGAQLLVDAGYSHILCSIAELHWQLMYYSGGKLICTGIYPHDRFQQFPNAVREAYWNGENVPAVSTHDQASSHLSKPMQKLGELWILTKPSPEDLEKLGYEMRIMY